MASKNTSPFLVQTWSIEGWTDGWTIAKPFRVQSGTYLFMLKSSGYGGDDKNVHICVLEPDGDLGPKKFTKKWSEGWTSAEFFQQGHNKRYFLFVKARGFGSDGNNIHVNEVLDSGDIGENVFSKKVEEGWTHAKVYSVGNKQLLILVMRSGFDAEGKNVRVYEMLPNGRIGTQKFTKKWTEGWSTVLLYPAANESTILLCLKESGDGADGNNAHLHTMLDSGEVGPRLKSYSWTEGWDCVQFFRAEERSYLIFIKSGTGTVHINHVLEDGKVGGAVCHYDRNPSYTDAFGTGSLADWGPRPWTSGWTTVESVELGGKPHLFALKRKLTGNQEKRSKIYRVNPMQSVGPMVSYVSRNEATIWVGTVASTSEGTVSYKPDSKAAQEVKLEFGGAPGEYYRAGVAHLNGLLEDTTYTYKVRLGDKMFGGGSFRTAPRMGRGKFTVAVVSCMDLADDREQAVWKYVLDQSPHLLLQTGDNAYPNTTMRSMIWAEHLQQRGVQAFAKVICEVPSLATWDDHDFGPNNPGGADVERDHRDESQAAFRELFPGLPFHSATGIYYKARWGDVEFFMLDNRYFRNRYKNGNPLTRTMLGEAQWTWLEGAVAASDARFRVIVSGTTIDTGATETWAENYPMEWVKLRALTSAHPGVLVVSGDIHKCRIEHHALNGNRKLWEIISSGISGQYGNEHAFATLTFDTTVDGGEKVTCRFFRQNGTERKDGKVILLSQIS